VELAVLLVSLIVGIALGALLAWVPRLLGTGHPPRRQPAEIGAASPSEEGRERGVGLELLVAVLAFIVLMLIALSMTPGAAEWMVDISDVPGGHVIISFAVLIVAVVYALPVWMGVRH
jgi:NADH:ubiquinone oxidoreductase subunit 3 (subunit A)